LQGIGFIAAASAYCAAAAGTAGRLLCHSRQVGGENDSRNGHEKQQELDGFYKHCLVPVINAS
jgi:hypothetical protein